MNRIIKILSSKKGLTLIEMIVSMVIFLIIASAVAFIFPPTYKTYRETHALAETSSLMDTLSQEILNDVSRAKEFSITKDTLTVTTIYGKTTYYVYSGADEKLDGVLCRDEDIPVWETRYYNNKKLKMTLLSANGVDAADGIKDQPFIMRLTILDSTANPIAQKDYAANPISII